MSDEHFSVDGTLIQAWASQKSFQPKPRAGRTCGQERRAARTRLARRGGTCPAGRNQERDWRGPEAQQ